VVTIEGIGLEPERVETYAANIVLSVAAIVQRNDGKVLVIWEGDMPYHNMWTVPIGYVQQNENVVDAVPREVREETGLDIETVGLVGVYDDFIDLGGKKIHHVIVCYRTKALTKPPTVTREAKEYVWIGSRQVKGLKTPRVVKDMLSDYFR
jgi:ADP-ribose pyrophosphatase YjhB (NUDIX family)